MGPIVAFCVSEIIEEGNRKKGVNRMVRLEESKEERWVGNYIKKYLG